MKKEEQLLGNIVAKDFRAASLLSKAGLDFCCGGNKTLEAACIEKGIRTEEILKELDGLEKQPAVPGQNFNEWQPDFLCDYIVNSHHSYIRRTLSDLVFYTGKIRDVHGERHPELISVAELFGNISRELPAHMEKEEKVLFPAIKEALKTKSQDAMKVIYEEMDGMKEEHEFVGGAMDKINVITSGYKVPPDGCNTYTAAYRMLKQFEDDLHIHVHLENNILFPKALSI
jgi:regulator of cell morphogenesis and NO signaling